MIEEILPRLHRVVVPLTGNPLREINSYVLSSNDRNLIIDTGMNRPDCREVLEAGLDEIGVDLERTDFIATHLHADHEALISTLAARSGFPAGELQASLRNHPGNKFGPSTAVDYVPLHGGETFEIGEYCLKIVPTPGHTDGHISVYEPSKKIFFSVDHVLGDITPNIQAWTDDHDPLAVYLASLEKVSELDVDLCLPGHRSFVEDFGKRIAELVEHHRERANEAIAILSGSRKTAYQTASEMRWDIVANSWGDFPIMQRWFATGEAIAHLRYVEGKGLIQRELVDGQILYSSDGKSRL